MAVEGWVHSSGVRIHYLDSGQRSESTSVPVLFVPGMLGIAEHFASEMDYLAPRRCAALSLRGRGKSEAPLRGYTFEDHVADIESVADHLGWERFCLMGYSVGVAYAIGFASRHPDRLAGLIVGDYPARYPEFSGAWVDRVLSLVPPQVTPEVARAIRQDSRELSLWDWLESVLCPVLVIRAGGDDALLSPEDAERYGQRLPQVRTVVFEDSGHFLASPDPERYLRTLREFLGKVDASA